MKLECSKLVAAFGVVAALAGAARGGVVPVASGVVAWFGSSAPYQSSDPAGYSYSPPAIGPYGSGVLGGSPTPAAIYPIAPAGNAFQGTVSTSTFNDGYGTTAQSNITDSVNPTPTVTADVSVSIPSWSFNQGFAGAFFAWEQLNFDAQYQVTGPLAGSTPNLPLYISGFVAPGAGTYAEFDAQITYTAWTYNLINGTYNSATLGTLTYQWTQSGGGAFATSITSSGTLAGVSSPAWLELSGYAWVAGDPFSIEISSVPEPSSLGLLALGALALVGRHRRVPAAGASI